MGDNMFDTLTRGDLYVIITVENDVRFRIHGINLIAELEIDSIDAMLGCEKVIVGLDNRQFNVKIPQACQYGMKFGLAGQGLYQMNSNVRGDLVVDVTIKTPYLTEEQLNIVKNIRTTQ
jgi:molecular chaperone DnaJ